MPGAQALVGMGFYLRDPQAPIRQRLTVATSLLYLFSPVDIIPEIFLGPLGLADDAAVGLVLARFLFSRGMRFYREQARRWLREE